MAHEGRVLVAVGGWGPCYQRLNTVACLRLGPNDPPSLHMPPAPEPQPEAERLEPPPAFAVDDVVILHGLVGAAQHNGKRGTVRGFDEGNSRYKVSVGVRAKPLGVKAINMILSRGWEMLPPMRAKRVGPAVVTTASGAIFVAGGAGDGADGGAVEIYEPCGSWRDLPPMPQGERSSGRACVLANGRVLVIGGLGKRGRSITGIVEAWAPPHAGGGNSTDAEGGSWSSLCSMRTARVNFGACTLPGGFRVIAVGGEVAPSANGGGAGAITQDVEIYDATTDNWAALPPMSVERHGCGCATLADGTVLIVGGYGGLDRRRVDAATGMAPEQLFSTPETATSGTVDGALAPPRSKRMTTSCPCCVVFVGEAGKTNGRLLHSAELAADCGGGCWTYLPAPALGTSRKAFGDCAFGGGMVVLGGTNNDNEILADAEWCDGVGGGDEDKWVWAAQEWLPPLPTPRSSFGLVLSTVQALGL